MCVGTVRRRRTVVKLSGRGSSDLRRDSELSGDIEM